MKALHNIKHLLAFAALGTGALNAADVTLESLLKEMTSRDTIAQFPEPAYTNKQFSSASPIANDPNNPETWFQNQDWAHFVRVEQVDGRYEHVLVDAKGPGAIVRIWNTIIKPHMHEGILRIYIDGAEEPAIEGKNGELISGGKLVGAPLSSSSAETTVYHKRGHNLYLPIPYAKSCKITYQQPNGQRLAEFKETDHYYYNINYRTYAPGTTVESFSLERLQQAQATLDETQQTLAASAPNGNVLKTETKLEGVLTAGESQSIQLAAPPSGASIRNLRFQLKADDLPQALRSTILEISFDGDRTVWTPIGDFFGTGYQVRSTKFWYGSVSEEGLMQAHWVMPYQKNAKVTVHNLGKQDVELLEAEIDLGAWNWNEHSMHFGSNWHQYTGVRSGGTENGHGGRGAWDMNYVTLNGQGVYVGDILTLFDCAKTWWGEGDEKIYVDGESFPSHFGTGTEDYYGYAWCIGEKFQTPFITQPDGTGDLDIGYVVNGRYRLLDGIPFNKSIRVDMEQWHWAKTDMDIAPTTYWYGRPGILTNKAPDIENAKHKVAIVPSDVAPAPVFNAKGRLECEYLPIANISGGKAEPQNLRNWSRGGHLWWHGGKKGDILEITFEANAQWAGTQNLSFGLTQAVDYAQVAIQLNGKTIKNKFEGYSPNLGRTELIANDCTLVEGTNTLKIKLVGANPDARPGMMFGLDYIQIQ